MRHDGAADVPGRCRSSCAFSGVGSGWIDAENERATSGVASKRSRTILRGRPDEGYPWPSRQPVACWARRVHQDRRPASPFADIHPTDIGYATLAGIVAAALAYASALTP